MKCEHYETAYGIVVEPENKAVSQTTDGFFKIFLNQKYRSGTSSLRALDEVLQLMTGGCGFKKFSPFFEVFNEKIGQLIAAGVLKEFNERFLPSIKTKTDEIGPQVLTMEHLGLGFIACLIPLGLAIAVFCMEFVVHGLRRERGKHSLKNNLRHEIKHRTPKARLPISLLKLDEEVCWTKHLYQHQKSTKTGIGKHQLW